MPREFRMPDIGEGLTEAEIIEWLVEEGAVVKAGQAIVEVETAKTTVEIPAPTGGRLIERHGTPGDTIQVGEVLFVIDDEVAAAVQAARPDATARAAPIPRTAQTPPPKAAEAPEPPPVSPPSRGSDGRRPKAMPLIRRLARDRGIDLEAVTGSGPGGAITRDDLDRFEPDDSIRLEPLSAVRRAIATHMTESWTSIPHVTVQAEVRAEALLADRGLRTRSPLPLEGLVAAAAIPLLRRHPVFNASFRDDAVAYAIPIHVGFAVDTDAGLMVVVVRDADARTVTEIGNEFERLSQGARARSLAPDDVTGQTFTISNIGALGGGHGTPIIPLGTAAILSIGRATQQPVVEDGSLDVGWVAPIDLSYDHRIIDGADGQQFLGDLVDSLETPLTDRDDAMSV